MAQVVAPIHLLAKREGPLDRRRGGPWGMNQPANYTPLESLFLFQSLVTHGIDTGAFTRISELLRGNALIKGDDKYDPARLSPDALQQLFLLLLRDELKGESDGVNGNDAPGSPGSRKRKLGSPPMPTLKDASAHIEKLPILVDRLYARYREHTVKQIRDEESRLQVLQKEITVLERSERERMARVAMQNAKQTPGSVDGKQAAGFKGPGLSTTPTPGMPAGIRTATSTTPVLPPKLPISTSKVAPPAGVPASHLSAAKPPIRPSVSPKPPTGAAPVLQAPPGAQQAVSQTLQSPIQPPQTSISPRPEAAAQAKDGSSTPSGGPLKWEKPYQPSSTGQMPAVGQRGAVLPPKTQAQVPQTGYPPPTPGQAPPNLQSKPTAKPVLVPPQNAGQLPSTLQPGTPRPVAPGPSPHARPQSVTPVPPPGRLIQPQQQAQQVPRPIASASPTPPPTGSVPLPQRRPQAPIGQQGARPSPSASPVPPSSHKDKPYASPYVPQLPRPPIPEHMIRQAASTPQVIRRGNAASPSPQTPSFTIAMPTARGSATKWVSQSTPSTPKPLATEPESPAFEPASPPLKPLSLPQSTPKSGLKKQVPRPTPKLETSGLRQGRGRPPRAGKRSSDAVGTPTGPLTRRSQSVTSQADELSMDLSNIGTDIKHEESTPRPHEDGGDTTADESGPGRGHMVTPSSVSSRVLKRKRQETPTEPLVPPSQIMWTRGFTKVSSSVLDQISGHRDANMFASALRERDAPGYRQIVLQPQDLTSIRAAIKQGNKAAVQAAASLPGGDPGTASVWLPISEDLVPPKGIVNSAQLERELDHMFCNAIMYNPDPDRGPGPGFMKRSKEEEDEVVGYLLDENGIVKNTRGMFVEVEKLMSDLRSAEKERSAPPPSATRTGSVATPADDTAEDEDELAADMDTVMSTMKRRRAGTRS